MGAEVLKHTLSLLSVLALALPACSEDDPEFNLISDNSCPPDAGQQICPGGGGGGIVMNQPDATPQEDADMPPMGEPIFAFTGLSVVNGESVVIIPNCPAGGMCTSTAFQITNVGDATGSITLSDPDDLGTLDPVCRGSLAPDASCDNALQVLRPNAPGTVQCLGRLTLSDPVAGQDTLPVCLETTFGQCLSTNCP